MKNHHIFLLFVLTNLISFAQVNFEDQLIFYSGALSVGDPSNLKLADLDNDGDLDLIVSSGAGDKVAWYEHLDGQGHFSLLKEIDTNAELVINIHTADVNGDGYLDVISNCWTANEIVWYKNTDGQGGFEEQTAIAIHTSARGFGAPMDVDNDGDVDFISTSNSSLVWFENIDGEGNFGSAIVIPNTAPGFVHTSDFDNDGDLDLLSRSLTNDAVSWYENLGGQGVFGSEQLITIYGEGATSILTADFDNDGDNDILTAISSEQRIHWYENLDGQGAFSPLEVISTTISSNHIINAADIDSDGDIDILSQAGDSVVWFENLNGQGDFGTLQSLISNLETPTYFTVGDIDNDNDLDIVSTGENNAQITLAWYKNEDGQASYFSNHIVSRYIYLDFETTFADMDGDGFPDLVSSKDWYRNIDGEGNFDFEYGNVIGDVELRKYIAFDFDNDNDLDLVGITKNYPRQIVWYENLGLGVNFTFHTLIPSFDDGNSPDNFLLGDMNNDNLVDIITVKSSEFSNLYMNLGNSNSFATAELITTDIVEEIVDFDGDGDNDLLVTTNSSNEQVVYWKENIDGNGAFGPDIMIEDNIWGDDTCSGWDKNSATATDVDSDGDLDIIFYGYTTDDCQYPIWFHYAVWYENIDGNGNFSEKNEVFFEQEIFSVNTLFLISEDMDNDGDNDLFLAEFTSYYLEDYRRLYWYENINGLGDFQIHDNISENLSQFIYTIKPFDINADGLMDIFYYDDTLRWLKNTGDNLGIDQVMLNEFVLYPNPTSGILNINTSTEIVKLVVYDISGKEILTKANKTSIDISSLSNGLYLIEIHTITGNKRTKKFLKI